MVQYQINEKGLFNRRELSVASPLFTEKLIGISSGPLNVQTGIYDNIQEQTMPYGVNFYKLEGENRKLKLMANVDTCNNVPVDTNAVKKLIDKDNSPLIIASNESVFCIPYETRPSINELLRSSVATQLAPRQQIIGTYTKNDTKFILGKPEIPLDVFIDKTNFNLEELCTILNDCR
ncbi:hypothetical protein RZD42_000220 [Enterobacter asburiae]|nr:hypothetical protein [Enterobacter asburiae]